MDSVYSVSASAAVDSVSSEDTHSLYASLEFPRLSFSSIELNTPTGDRHLHSMAVACLLADLSQSLLFFIAFNHGMAVSSKLDLLVQALG